MATVILCLSETEKPTNGDNVSRTFLRTFWYTCNVPLMPVLTYAMRPRCSLAKAGYDWNVMC